MEILTGAPARVARALLDVGQATVAELAERLDLSGAAVRKHMDDLVEAGLAEASDRPTFGPDIRQGCNEVYVSKTDDTGMKSIKLTDWMTVGK